MKLQSLNSGRVLKCIGKGSEKVNPLEPISTMVRSLECATMSEDKGLRKGVCGFVQVLIMSYEL